MTSSRKGFVRKINIEAALVSSKQELLRLMAYLPNAKQVSMGSEIKFELDLGDGKGKLYLTCSKNAIIFEFNSDNPAKLEMAEIIIIVLAILAYLEGVYSAKIGSLYPIIIDSMRSLLKPRKLEQSNSESSFYDELRQNNLALAKLAIRYYTELQRTSSRLKRLSRLLGLVSGIYWSDSAELNRFCLAAGISESEVKPELEQVLHLNGADHEDFEQ